MMRSVFARLLHRPTLIGLLFTILQPWAFECRENLRKMLVGKEITFTVTHSLPPSNTDSDVQRDVGTVEFNGIDLATDLLRTGWARTKESTSKREPSDEELKRKDVENEAKAAGRGIWRPEGPPVCTSPCAYIRALTEHFPLLY